MQVILAKISYIGSVFKVWFMQDSSLFRVWFRQVSLYYYIVHLKGGHSSYQVTFALHLISEILL